MGWVFGIGDVYCLFSFDSVDLFFNMGFVDDDQVLWVNFFLDGYDIWNNIFIFNILEVIDFDVLINNDDVFDYNLYYCIDGNGVFVVVAN